MARARTSLGTAGHMVLFFALFAAWELFDRLTKTYFDSALTVGKSIAGPLPGVFTFTLVHNTGGAWGMLSDATLFLGIFSVAVSVALAVFALRFNRGATWVETASLALVVAGGFGNAVDRFALGYVVDFINVSFIDFPVFNIADIGVTVGMLVFFIALLVRTLRESKQERAVTPAAQVQDAAFAVPVVTQGDAQDAEVVALIVSDAAGSSIESIDSIDSGNTR